MKTYLFICRDSSSRLREERRATKLSPEDIERFQRLKETKRRKRERSKDKKRKSKDNSSERVSSK